MKYIQRTEENVHQKCAQMQCEYEVWNIKNKNGINTANYISISVDGFSLNMYCKRVILDIYVSRSSLLRVVNRAKQSKKNIIKLCACSQCFIFSSLISEFKKIYTYMWRIGFVFISFAYFCLVTISPFLLLLHLIMMSNCTEIVFLKCWIDQTTENKRENQKTTYNFLLFHLFGPLPIAYFSDRQSTLIECSSD